MISIQLSNIPKRKQRKWDLNLRMKVLIMNILGNLQSQQRHTP